MKKDKKQRKCLRCGYLWYQRFDRKPKHCPQCNSPYWDKPRGWWKKPYKLGDLIAIQDSFPIYEGPIRKLALGPHSTETPKELARLLKRFERLDELENIEEYAKAYLDYVKEKKK